MKFPSLRAAWQSWTRWTTNAFRSKNGTSTLAMRYDEDPATPRSSFDPATSSWRTSQHSLLGGLTEFSGTWPRSGTMRNGECSALTPSERPNTVSESGYWHTPTTRDWKGQSGKGNRIRRGKGGRLHIANLCDQLVDFGRLDLVRSYTFREWLMGLPIGWTALEDSETP